MAQLSEDVELFLENTHSAEGRELDVAIACAESMARELRVSVAEWEAAAARLQEMRRRCAVGWNCN
jgi:hypothetical protein